MKKLQSALNNFVALQPLKTITKQMKKLIPSPRLLFAIVLAIFIHALLSGCHSMTDEEIKAAAKTEADMCIRYTDSLNNALQEKADSAYDAIQQTKPLPVSDSLKKFLQ